MQNYHHWQLYRALTHMHTHTTIGRKWMTDRDRVEIYLWIAYGVQIKIVFSSENNNIVHFIWTSICTILVGFSASFLCVWIGSALRTKRYDVCIRRCCSKRIKKEEEKKWLKFRTRARALSYEHTSMNNNGCCWKWESAWENKTRGMLYQLISSSSSFLVCCMYEIVCIFFYPHHWVPV